MITLYDQEITAIKSLLENNTSTKKETVFSPFLQLWPLSQKEEIILRSDMALELGGSQAYATSGIFFTTSSNLISESKITVIGPDLNELYKKYQNNNEAEINYARIVVIKLKEEAVTNKEPQQLYAIFRKLEYIRYHIFPQGFALRISTVQNKEVVRIAKEAVNEGLGLGEAGNTFVKAFLDLPEVEAVHIYFAISDTNEQNTLHSKLKEISEKSYEITESLNTIFQGLKMDCSTCAQKPLCDTVEGMKELHQGVAN